MAKQELLKWISDCDAVDTVLKMLEFEPCLSCQKIKGSGICVRCGACFCQFCPREARWRESGTELLDSCISCNDTVCWRCYDRCARCFKVTCDLQDELCRAEDLALRECKSCGEALCKSCISTCRSCKLPYCSQCFFDGYQSCSKCVAQWYH